MPLADDEPGNSIRPEDAKPPDEPVDLDRVEPDPPAEGHVVEGKRPLPERERGGS
jgi:hypothetical protein